MLRASAAAIFAVALAALPAFAQPADDGSAINGRYIVKFTTNPAAGTAALHSAGASIALPLPNLNAAAVYIPEQALEGLRHNPNIEYIEVDHPRFPTSLDSVPYGIKMVQAHLVTTGAAPTSLCIIDSGLQADHPDFAPAAGQSLVISGVDDPGSGTNSGSGPWNQDGCGHGTHVAGTIAALANDAGVVGVNAQGGLELVIVKVFGGGAAGTDPCTWTYSSNLVAALGQCTAQGAKVVSMSLGGRFSSTAENAAFDDAFNTQGMISFAAAGNAGRRTTEYPSGYASVISVAAIDGAEAKASFSNQNNDVEIAAPGVDTMSSIPNAIERSEIAAGTARALGTALTGTLRGSATGTLLARGYCSTALTGVSDAIVLCERGNNTFADKAARVTAAGGAGVVIYNNVNGGFGGTLGTSPPAIIAIGVERDDGLALLAQAGQAASLSSTTFPATNGWGLKSGTSMATPHASAVAALVWSHVPVASNAQLRDALTSTAKDLGAAGRDISFGFGLVRAQAALTALLPLCATSEQQCSDGRDDDCDGSIDQVDSDCVSAPPCVPSSTGDDCNDSLDNDCDGAVDAADPEECPPPVCVPSGAEICGNGVDEDCVGGDEACPPPACTPSTEICSDGIDNDCDGVTDEGLAKGVTCTSSADCCSGSCGGRPGRKTCK